MRYFFEKPEFYFGRYGRTHYCNHAVYSRCTLFEIDHKGLAVIQQRYNPENKTTWWGEIDPWLVDAVYLNKGFRELFLDRAGADKDGIFPTITIRQLMWALKMKPIPKEVWETVFDRKDI